MKHHLARLLSLALLAVAVAAPLTVSAQIKSLPARENNEGQVRVLVTPESLPKTADTWRFRGSAQYSCDAAHPGSDGRCITQRWQRCRRKASGLGRRSAGRPSPQGCAGVQTTHADATSDHIGYPRSRRYRRSHLHMESVESLKNAATHSG